MRSTFVAATAALTGTAVSTPALGSSAIVRDVLWKRIRDFCGVGVWRPAVDKCVVIMSRSGKHRTRSLKGRVTTVETPENRNDANPNYTYPIVSKPPPLTGYRSTISVKPANGPMSNWIGNYVEY
jgi:hypothetical protein